MNTKGIIWEPICMLTAGEGTFCNAGGWVMLQLSPTLSLWDWDNAIVLLLHVFPFPFSISPLPPLLLAPKPHLIPVLPPTLSLSARKPFYLHLMSSFHLQQTKCSIVFPSVEVKREGGDKERWRKREKERRGNHSHWRIGPETTALFPHLPQVTRTWQLCVYTSAPLSSSLNPPHQLAHERTHADMKQKPISVISHTLLPLSFNATHSHNREENKGRESRRKMEKSTH